MRRVFNNIGNGHLVAVVAFFMTGGMFMDLGAICGGIASCVSGLVIALHGMWKAGVFDAC